jgi:hypothetical protein
VRTPALVGRTRGTPLVEIARREGYLVELDE